MIEVDEKDGVHVVLLRHGKVNALDLELLEAIRDTFARLPQHAPVVLTGGAGAFSAGVDLRRILDGGAEYVSVFLPALSQAFLAVFDHDGPTVAAVNGHAIAGGLILAAACDRRVMAEGGGKLGLSELAVGVPFPLAALEIVRATYGDAITRELVLRADLYEARPALQLGLVDALFPPDMLVDQAWSLARLRPAGEAYALTKARLHGPARDRIRERAELDDPAVAACWAAEDTHARIRAFLAAL